MDRAADQQGGVIRALPPGGHGLGGRNIPVDIGVSSGAHPLPGAPPSGGRKIGGARNPVKRRRRRPVRQIEQVAAVSLEAAGDVDPASILDEAQHRVAAVVEAPAVGPRPGRPGVGGTRRHPAGLNGARPEHGEAGQGQHSRRRGPRRRGQRIEVVVDEAGVDATGGEVGMAGDAAEEIEIGRDPGDADMAKPPGQTPQRIAAVAAMGDQLGDHRVVLGGDRPGHLVDARIDAQRLGRRAEIDIGNPARRRQETARRVFGIEARLDRMAVDRKLALRLRQRLARRDAELPFDQIGPGDLLGHRMLDLKPRVHLHEPELARGAVRSRLDNEFHGARANIVDSLCRRDRRCADFPPV